MGGEGDHPADSPSPSGADEKFMEVVDTFQQMLPFGCQRLLRLTPAPRSSSQVTGEPGEEPGEKPGEEPTREHDTGRWLWKSM